MPPLVALTFLTTVPARLPRPPTEHDFPRAVGYFPLVGAGLGVAVTAADVLFVHMLPALLAGALDLAVLALLTGGLHLDGLADSADGLLGAHDPAARLSIMRDSRTGAFASAAVALVLLVEFAALSALSGPARLAAFPVCLALFRWAMALTLWRFPSARRDGSAAAFGRGVRGLDLAVASVFALALALALEGPRGLVLVAVAGAVALALGRFATARLGGVTGDICGASGELTFAALLVMLVAAVR